MNKDFLTEAFRSMNIINEEAFDVDMKGAEEAEDFLDKDEYELLTVIDDEAKDEEEIKSDYTGKVIIECNTCHSKLFKDKEDIKIEDDIVNKDEECPYCNSLDGYVIIGQIAPYEEKDNFKETLKEGFETIKKAKEAIANDEELQAKLDSLGWLLSYINIDYDAIVKDFKKDNFEESLNKSLNEGITVKMSRDDFDRMCRENSILQGLNRSDYIEIRDLFYIGYEDFDAAVNDLWDGDDGYHSRDWYEDLLKKYTNNINEPLKESEGPGEVIEEAASVGEDIDKYQEWVDYDMKRYGKISDETNRDVKEAGLQIVKDKYGDYRVIAGKYDEKLNESKKPSKKFIKEQLKRNKKSLRERLEEISVKTDDNKIEVIEDEEGKVTVTSEPACEEPCEVIEEVPEEVKDEIIDNQKEDSEDVDVDIDEIDTDTFGDLTERYLKKTYGNVKCFECKSSKKKNNKIVVEGFITFNSGNKKATQFIFEGHSMDKKGKMKLIGENKQLSNGKKSFVIRGHQDNNKVVCESLNYRYNQNNKMIRGSIKNI